MAKSCSTTMTPRFLFLTFAQLITASVAFTASPMQPTRSLSSKNFISSSPRTHRRRSTATSIAMANMYDEWASSGLVDTTYLSEDTIFECLENLIESEYGRTMFGCHDATSNIGITGDISFVELAGPQVILKLEGAFWHRRATVLGKAAVWLNARMPEVTDVTVEDREELLDFEEIKDEFSGDVIAREDKRAPDFNGDRATMEYQGLDPDERGPFPPSIFGSSRLTINPV